MYSAYHFHYDLSGDIYKVWSVKVGEHFPMKSRKHLDNPKIEVHPATPPTPHPRAPKFFFFLIVLPNAKCSCSNDRESLKTKLSFLF